MNKILLVILLASIGVVLVALSEKEENQSVITLEANAKAQAFLAKTPQQKVTLPAEKTVKQNKNTTNHISGEMKNPPNKSLSISTSNEEPIAVISEDYVKSKVSRRFVIEVESYEGSFVPLDTLPETEVFCVTSKYKASSQGIFVSVSDGDGIKRRYSCEYVPDESAQHKFKWVEVYI